MPHMEEPNSRPRQTWKQATLTLLAVGLSACSPAGDLSEDADSTSSKSQALTSSQLQILGFESPLSHWTSTGTLSASTQASEGAEALGVIVDWYTTVQSETLGTLEPLTGSMSIDVLLPQTPTHAELAIAFS